LCLRFDRSALNTDNALIDCTKTLSHVQGDIETTKVDPKNGGWNNFSYLCVGRSRTLKIYYKINTVMGKTLELTDATFDETLKSDKPVLVDFWAEWCGPCKMIGPVVEELANDYEGKAVIAKLNVDENPQVTARFGVRSIPTLLVFKNGQIVDKQVGAVPKSVLAGKLQAQVA
jgi:thioredoxin 1